MAEVSKALIRQLWSGPHVNESSLSVDGALGLFYYYGILECWRWWIRALALFQFQWFRRTLR